MHLPEILSLLFHPVIFYLVELLLLVLVIGFTSPTAILRLAVVPLMIACTCKAVSVSPTLLRGPWSAWCCGLMMFNLMHYVESALIVKWDFKSQSPTSSTRPRPEISAGKRNDRSEFATTMQTREGTIRKRFGFGYFILLSYRNVGTPYIVKGTPGFSTKDPNYIPSRREFLFRKVIIIGFALLALEFASLTAQPLEYNKAAFSVEAVPIFRGNRANLTMEKITFRLVTVLGFWLITYVVIDGIFSLPSFLNVALDIDDVRACRPNFGSVYEAYSIRQFWSVFWHQHLRKSLSAPADFLVYKVLRFPKGALFTRYLNLSLVFLFSGLLHESVNIAEGFHRPYAGSVIFFMTQALGIILEDAVQAVYRAIRGVPRGTSPTLLARAIGYVWLALFLCWSTPIWIYAQQSASRGEQGDNLLPFSLLGLLKNIPIPKSIIPLGHHKRD